MSDDRSVSRRASLKSLGAIGAAMALGRVASAQTPAQTKPAKSDQDKPAASAVDVAADRFSKGHS